MIKDIIEINFPDYATLDQATVTINDMGDRTISAQVKIDGSIVPDFSFDWEVEFKGEKYIHPVREPQGSKDNTSRRAKIDMVFYHWAIYEMKRQYFMEMASTSAGTAVTDKYVAPLGLNLGDFVTAFNLVLNHYFGGKIIMKLNPEWQYDTEASFVNISYSYIWDVLQQMHEIYGVRWTLKTNADGVCEILMGYPAEEVSHIFEYGFEGGLLSVQRQVQSTDIRNRLLGRGGSKNLPYRYFKDKDPNNPLFEADPDWIPELANIAFTELRGKTFRDYVRGWKAKRYGGTVMTEPTEAYLAGYNAEKFDPIEYVDDKESIEKYGILVGALENNEEIYPSIQGAPNDVDAIVEAEQVTDDDVDSAVENDSVTTNLESGHQTYRNAPANSTVTIETLTKRYFSVPEGKVGNLSMSLTATGKYSNLGDYEETHPILKSDTVKVTIHDKTTGAEVKSSSVPVVDIPTGDYYYMISADVETNYDKTSMVTLNIESVYLYTSTPNKSEGWKQTFDIWVRNIWGSTRSDGETDQQYADRVWLPILGDRMGDEARVVFASGWLSFSSDWEFPIVGYAYDDSKEGSHWRLTLAKSEAELEASGKYIPYEGYNASAGDRFFFIGIDMPYQYVLWAEERLDGHKRDALLQSAQIKPTWVIKADKVKLNQDRNGPKLIDSLAVGSHIRLASKQFISGAYESLYVQSMTYNWTADTILYPDVEVVVSDKVHTVKNPVAQIQGNIETLQRQMGSLSNIQQIIRQVCDQLYLRKDGVEDSSKSPTRFLGKVTGEKFRQGQIGGRDWGIYRDENGNAILEADKFVARQGILVSDLVVNEATYVGGLQINSAAAMKVTAVEETEGGYICYFDQQQGSVTNKFKVDDVVLCQKFDPNDNEVKFYKRRIVAVAETSVTLSKNDVNGDGIPAIDDEIIHYGNYSDKTRQFVIIRDVIGGGYERMLMGLDSVTSEGFEYYFAGKSADSTARWFVGDANSFAKYENGQFTVKGNLLVTGSDKSISEQLGELDYIKKALGEGLEGLILGSAIVVGYNDENGSFVPMAGISGVYDKEASDGGPAAWYGGTLDNATSKFNMDGTGYLASGMFAWDLETGLDLGKGGIKINYDGSIDFGGNIRIGSTGEETLDSLLTIVAKLSDYWKVDDDGNLTTDMQVFIKNNLIVNGDTASGGKSGGASPAAAYLTDLLDVSAPSPSADDLLMFNGREWVNTPQSAIVPNIESYKDRWNGLISSTNGSTYIGKKLLFSNTKDSSGSCAIEVTEDAFNILYLPTEDGTIATRQWVEEAISKAANAIKVTYDELAVLLTKGNLVEGCYYRITDYVTTTSQAYTSSAGKRFDVIVLALSNNSLSEEAFAAPWSNGTQFSLNEYKWKIWYCFRNDSDRFAWALGGGKGVIYRMIDEHGIDCPYDFKNIQFWRMLSKELRYSSNTEWASERIKSGLPTGWVFMKDEGIKYFDDREIVYSLPNTWEQRYFFTFWNSDTDYSTSGNVRNVTILPTFDASGKRQQLNNNVFFGSDAIIENVRLGYYNYNNTFRAVQNIAFGDSCAENNLGSVNNITLGNRCYLNIVKGNNVKLGSFSSYNTLGDNISGGSYCSYNSFLYPELVTMGEHCEELSSSWGAQETYYLTFGNYCKRVSGKIPTKSVFNSYSQGMNFSLALNDYPIKIESVIVEDGSIDINISPTTREENILVWDGESAKYASIGGYLKLTGGTVTGDVHIKGNLIIDGETASGGESSGTTQLTAYLKDLLDVNIPAPIANDLLMFNGSKWVNVAQSSIVPSLTSSSIVSALGYTPFNAANFTKANIVNAIGTTTYAPYNANGYLPLSGGILSGTSADILTINRRDSDAPTTIVYNKNGNLLGRIGFNTSGNPVAQVGGTYYNILTSAGGTISGDLEIKKESGESTLILGTNGRVVYNPTDGSTSLYNGGSGYPALKVQAGLGHPIFRYNYKDYPILHSGNVGDYACKAINIDSDITDTDKAYIGRALSAWTNWGKATNNPNGVAYASGLTISFAGNAFQIAKDAYDLGKLYVRMSNYQSDNIPSWSAWKTIAFTDSNVASATKLKTARTIWGQSFDGSGNVSGGLYLGSGSIYRKHNDADASIVTFSEGVPYFGYGTAGAGYNTVIDGNAIMFRTSSSHSNAMRINSSGNVTIGGSDLAGNDHKLYVSGHSGFVGNLDIYGGGKIQSYSNPLVINAAGNNVIIGTTEDSGHKLSVLGNGLFVDTSKKGISSSRIKDNAVLEIGAIGKGNDGLYIGQLENSSVWLQAAYGGADGYNSADFTKSILFNPLGGNVLIGKDTDNGEKLQVAGDITAFTFSNDAQDSFAVNDTYIPWYGLSVKDGYTNGVWLTGYSGIHIKTLLTEINVSNTDGVTINGDLRVTGNIIVTGDTASGGTASATNSSVLTITSSIPIGTSIAQSALDAIGLTSEVMDNLANGVYHYVKLTNSGRHELFNVSAYVGGNTRQIILQFGSVMADYGTSYNLYEYNKGSWNIEYNEI